MLTFRTILHPTDFSDSSKPAFELACAMARDYKAKLILVHVQPAPRVFAPDGIAVPFAAEETYDARVQLARMFPAEPGVEVEQHVLDGDPAAEILKAATTAGADVVVMGTHGTTGLTRLLVGSVAENVMRKAPCPVLTVRGDFRKPPAETVGEAPATA